MSNPVRVCDCEFDPQGRWCMPLVHSYVPGAHSVALFDQNGYDLCDLEIEYSRVNHGSHSMHRNHTHIALKQHWFEQTECTQGSVLNHALIFERKGYQAAALDQILTWAEQVPLLHKVARLRPKWGLDFSMDWADTTGNVFEILHYEFDSFDYSEITDLKQTLQQKFVTMDWDHAAQVLLSRKAEWHDLDFFAQSDYKCAFFGLGSERFKMVAWE